MKSTLKYIVAILALSAMAFAGTITDCTTMGCVDPTGQINWGGPGGQSYGTPGTVNTSPQNWSSTSNTGQVSVVGPTNFTLMQQGVSWFGNFTSGDYLIWNQSANNFIGNAGAIGVTFSSPVSAAGAQIQADFFGAFTATITAYGSSGVIGSFTKTGTSSANGSAMFLGFNDSTPNISYLTFNLVDVNGNNDEAIGTLYYSTGTANVVPEPSSFLLLGSGLLGALGYGRRRLGI
jgi:hypothetical protein